MQDGHGKNSIQQEEGSLRQHIGVKYKEEDSKVYIWSIDVHGAENWTLRKILKRAGVDWRSVGPFVKKVNKYRRRKNQRMTQVKMFIHF